MSRLPCPPEPVGLYEPYVVVRGLLVVSAISSAEDGALIAGKVGEDIDLATARLAAERAAINLVAVILDAVGGERSRVEQVLMVRGHVNAATDFTDVHKVIDAASEVIVAELGERGRHARTAIGCANLPNRNAVTLEAMLVTQQGLPE